ncbi:putative transporter [Psilocybe cubensis]|uniref:Transporter n=2 Tax=Psilocybe cubensis TaxID=181762 RepID=A0ACB8HD71_PSICU|nr:putative transporter [Psilocybe cubensis]KAH9485871.1 putative transporter [Psilocybe cubensis]
MDKVSSRTSGDPEKVQDRSSVSSGSPVTARDVDPALEKRIWRKMDLYILPVVTLFYLLSFLDRSNIGNARVAGLQSNLKMTNKQYSIALTVTYVPYIAAELPSNLLLKAVGPNLMLPTMLTLWGIVTTLQGVVKSYHGLLACRFFLGLFEGGVFPGLVLYLSFFYPRQKLQWRVSAFFSAASISGAFSGLLAFGIINMKGVGGRPGWAWIFILEGLFTVVFGVLSYFLLPRSPAHARFLSSDEKDYVVAALKRDGATGKNDTVDSFSWREVGEAFKLPQVWMLAVMFFFDGTILYGLAYFTPSIVQSLGYTASRAQLMSVPPFATAFVVSMAGAFISDRYRCRGLVTIFASVLAVIGFAMFLKSTKHKIQYASLFFSITGTYLAAPSLSTWSANNAAPYTRRATAIAIGFIMTNSGGILATWLLGSLSPAPHYTLATRVLLSFAVIMGVLAGLNTWYLWDQNKKKEVIRSSSTIDQEKPGLGDRSAWFVYAL